MSNLDQNIIDKPFQSSDKRIYRRINKEINREARSESKKTYKKSENEEASLNLD